MKKTLSVFLAVLMLFSAFGAFAVSAETGDLSDILYSEESVAASESALIKFTVNGLPEKFTFSFEERKNAENASVWNNINLLGMSLDFLYSAEGSLLWSELDVYQKDANNNLILDEAGNPILAITRDDISLAFTNINVYLQRVIYSRYGGLKLYNSENAVALANTIGKTLNPDFKALNPSDYTNLFTNEIPSANEFFRAVTSLSGLDVIIANNWVGKGRSYSEKLISLLGGGYIELNDDHYADGLILGSKLLESMVSKILTVGPVDYIYDLIKAFTSDAFAHNYRDPLLALFSLKIARTDIEENKLKSFDGLLQLIFCDCDAFSDEGCYGDGEIEHFSAFKFPIERINKTTDKDENLIFIYYYLNLCGRYKNNTKCINELKKSINDDLELSGEDKTKLKALVDGFLLGDFETAVRDAIVPLYKENISTAGDSIFDRFRNAFMIMMKKIADYFDYLRKIFSGELQYGQGNSPFN